MGKIFISYRRDDSTHITERIYDRLIREYGNDEIFKDVDSIPHGYDFRHVIRDAVESCDIVLAVIGKEWLTVTDDSGNKRIENEYDFVRMELDISLERNIRVIPILVDNAQMPKKDELPFSLESLSFRNSLNVRSDPDFNNDISRLIKSLNLSTNDTNKKEIISLSTFKNIEKDRRNGYVEISLIYKGDRYKTSVDSNASLEELKSLFMKKLGKTGEYEMVAMTHFGLIKDSQWKLVEKSKDDLLDDWEEIDN
jgi:hypothetical protein